MCCQLFLSHNFKIGESYQVSLIAFLACTTGLEVCDPQN